MRSRKTKSLTTLRRARPLRPRTFQMKQNGVDIVCMRNGNLAVGAAAYSTSSSRPARSRSMATGSTPTANSSCNAAYLEADSGAANVDKYLSKSAFLAVRAGCPRVHDNAQLLHEQSLCLHGAVRRAWFSRDARAPT